LLKLRQYALTVGKVLILLVAASSIIYMALGHDYFRTFNRQAPVGLRDNLYDFFTGQKPIRPYHWLVFQSFIVLGVTQIASYELRTRFEFTNWWIGRLVGIKKSPENVVLVLMRLRWVWPITCLLVLFALPSLAHAEEMMFRGYISSAEEALLFSAAFGLVHMITFVPLHQAMAMFLPALWFSYLFLKYDGLEFPVMSHYSYNAIFVSCLIATLCWKRLQMLGDKFLIKMWPLLLRH
jgi:membrane protease YdiL (CAAX protease family)